MGALRLATERVPSSARAARRAISSPQARQRPFMARTTPRALGREQGRIRHHSPEWDAAAAVERLGIPVRLYERRWTATRRAAPRRHREVEPLARRRRNPPLQIGRRHVEPRVVHTRGLSMARVGSPSPREALDARARAGRDMAGRSG